MSSTALIEIGANVKAASKNGFTPLVFAVTKNDVPSIKALLAAGADPESARWRRAALPLIVAMSYRHTAAALALLEGGADVNITRSGRQHAAARRGAAGRSGGRQGAARERRRSRTCARRDRRVAGGGRGGGGGFRGGPSGEQTPLMMAARGDHEDVMRALVAAGADPSLRAQDGSNVLMAAAGGARLKTFKYAYELDPDVDVVTTPAGNTIMHVSVALNGRTQPEVVEVMQFLADRGAKLDEMNAAGRTPIALADGLPVDLAVDLLTKLLTERGEKPKIPSEALSRDDPPRDATPIRQSHAGVLLLEPRLTSVLVVGAQEPTKTVADGVYTDAQAVRGSAAYDAACTQCHRADLTGADGPALRDERFAGISPVKISKPSTRRSRRRCRERRPGKSRRQRLSRHRRARAEGERISRRRPQELTAERSEHPRPARPAQASASGRRFLVRRVVGCLTPGPDNTWMLTNAAEPVSVVVSPGPRRRHPRTVRAKPLGSQTFHLLDAMAYNPRVVQRSQDVRPRTADQAADRAANDDQLLRDDRAQLCN